ncbi:hypothetical protein HK102_003872 [Quaeritorhiza haematococci]|nr:hypothetical protein HK102_003872 [Quaeritorhiza haematococci]
MWATTYTSFSNFKSTAEPVSSAPDEGTVTPMAALMSRAGFQTNRLLTPFKKFRQRIADLRGCLKWQTKMQSGAKDEAAARFAEDVPDSNRDSGVDMQGEERVGGAAAGLEASDFVEVGATVEEGAHRGQASVISLSTSTPPPPVFTASASDPAELVQIPCDSAPAFVTTTSLADYPTSPHSLPPVFICFEEPDDATEDDTTIDTTSASAPSRSSNFPRSQRRIRSTPISTHAQSPQHPDPFWNPSVFRAFQPGTAPILCRLTRQLVPAFERPDLSPESEESATIAGWEGWVCTDQVEGDSGDEETEVETCTAIFPAFGEETIRL